MTIGIYDEMIGSYAEMINWVYYTDPSKELTVTVPIYNHIGDHRIGVTCYRNRTNSAVET